MCTHDFIDLFITPAFGSLFWEILGYTDLDTTLTVLSCIRAFELPDLRVFVLACEAEEKLRWRVHVQTAGAT